MATYTAKCPNCAITYTYYRPIAGRDDVPICTQCNNPTERVLDAPMGFVDTPAAG